MKKLSKRKRKLLKEKAIRREEALKRAGKPSSKKKPIPQEDVSQQKEAQQPCPHYKLRMTPELIAPPIYNPHLNLFKYMLIPDGENGFVCKMCGEHLTKKQAIDLIMKPYKK